LPATAQSDDPMVFGTVHRPPFADTEGDQITGFSIDLMRAIAD
jgi:polar amino acid transport system substrate-binding protein